MIDTPIQYIFQDKNGNRSPEPRFGFRKYEVLPDGTLRPANRHARLKRAAIARRKAQQEGA